MQADQAHQCRGLDEHQPVIGEAGQRIAHHLGQGDADEGLHGAHAECPGGFHLALGDGKNRTPEGFGHVGTVDETNGHHASNKGVQIHALVAAHGFEQAVEADSAAVEDQQHHQQLGDAAHHSGVDRCWPDQHAPARELGGRARKPDQRSHQQ